MEWNEHNVIIYQKSSSKKFKFPLVVVHWINCRPTNDHGARNISFIFFPYITHPPVLSIFVFTLLLSSAPDLCTSRSHVQASWTWSLWCIQVLCSCPAAGESTHSMVSCHYHLFLMLLCSGQAITKAVYLLEITTAQFYNKNSSWFLNY